MSDQKQKKKTTALKVIKPEMGLDKFGTQKTDILSLVRSQMVENRDYGLIPNTPRKTLFQPGAEKLAKFFGLAPKYTLTKEVENFEKGFVYYRYKCELIHIATGVVVGDAERSSNSHETNKKNKTVFDLINTCQAMAQKRALVASVRTATMASDIFLGDIESNGKTGPTTKKLDPIRINLISKLHAVADPRGFNEEVLHSAVFKLYGVKSITELDNSKISEITEKMLANYEQVPKGSRPRKVIDGVEFGNGKPKEDLKPSDTVETLKCRNCNKPIEKGYFCDNDNKCSDEYWKKKK